MTDPLQDIFARLDRWRHFPAYQLERRADIFFAVYLREVVEAFTGASLGPAVIPEFPVRTRLFRPDAKEGHSLKVDYVLLSSDHGTAYLIELKTDVGSRNEKQDLAMKAARTLGFRALVEGVRDLAVRSDEKQKYRHLLDMLASLGFVEIPATLDQLLYPQPVRGVKTRFREIEVLAPNPQVEVLYVQPEATAGEACIDFAFFKKIVERHDDPFSRAFAEHLERWQAPAGSTPPG